LGHPVYIYTLYIYFWQIEAAVKTSTNTKYTYSAIKTQHKTLLKVAKLSSNKIGAVDC